MKFLIEQSTSTLPFRIQLIALSATIKNIEDLASWFRASLYVTTHRPVPLREMICAGLDVYDLMGTHLRKLNLPKLNLDIESNAMIFFAAEGLQHGQQVIIFCPSRNLCESTVRLICKHSELISPIQGIDLVEARKKAVERYKQTYLPGCHPTPGQELIEQGILHGVAYHHAGNLRLYSSID